jgi:hypothetical protein
VTVGLVSALFVPAATSIWRVVLWQRCHLLGDVPTMLRQEVPLSLTTKTTPLERSGSHCPQTASAVARPHCPSCCFQPGMAWQVCRNITCQPASLACLSSIMTTNLLRKKPAFLTPPPQRASPCPPQDQSVMALSGRDTL